MSAVASSSTICQKSPTSLNHHKATTSEDGKEASFLRKIWNTTLKEFEKVEGAKNFAKAPATYLSVFSQFFSLTPLTAAMKESSGLMKNGLSWAALPKNVEDLWKRLKKTVQVLSFRKDDAASTDKNISKHMYPRLHTLYKTYMKANAFVPTIYDGTKFFTDTKINILNLSKNTLATLGTINNASLLIYSSDEVRKNISKIANEKIESTDSPDLVRKTMDRIAYHMLNLAKHVSYVALALFGLATLFLTGIPTWGAPIASACALTFTFAALYFKGIKDDPSNPYIGVKLKKFRSDAAFVAK